MGKLRIIRTVETSNPAGAPVYHELRPGRQGFVAALVARLHRAFQRRRVPTGLTNLATR